MTIFKLLTPRILLVLICTLFIFTRLYKISEIPPAIYWDEASIGYNAYSIVQTGKDEWGKLFPKHFRAFGEFKLPVYIYATAIAVEFFGLNEFSVRLPSVLFSLGIVILTYLLARKISGNQKMGLSSSFFISISPWFFIFSRTGYEATAGLMFYLLGIFLFLFKLNGRLFLLSIASLVLSLYSYNSFRIIVPITLLILVFGKRDEMKEMLRKDLAYLTLGGILLILSMIPILRLYIYDAGASRFQAVGATGTSFIRNYFSHFSPGFLIFQGDKNLRSQQSGFGQLYLLDIPFLLLGFLYIIRSRSKYNFLILILLILGPIPAAITKESPHALRAISMAPFIAIISAIGILNVKQFTKKKILIGLAIALIFLAFFLNYLLNFFRIYPIQSSQHWQYGYKQIMNFKNDFSQYDHIIVSDEYAQPYIFALFYLRYDPEKFRREVVRNSVDQWGFSTVRSFDKFIFGKIKLSDLPKGKSLIFASAGEKLIGITTKDLIVNLDNSIAFYVYDYER